MSDTYDMTAGYDAVRSRVMWATVRRWSPLVVALTLVAAAGGWLWADRADPSYSATGVLELTDDQSGNTQRLVNQQEVAAQRQRLLSNDTRASLEAALGESAPLLGAITVGTDDESTLLTVKASADTAQVAVTAVHELMDLFLQQRLADDTARFQAELDVVNGNIAAQEATIAEITAALSAAEDGSQRRALEIRQQAAVNSLQALESDAQRLATEIALADGRVEVRDRPVAATIDERNKVFTAAQFGVLALLLSGGAVAALGSRNTKLRLIDEIDDVLPPDIPVLATVPKFRRQFRERQHAIVIGRPDAMREAEAFRFVRTSVELATAEHPTHTVAITSATPGEGKTVTAANLALSLASSGSPTLLVDGDLIAPSLPELSDRVNTVNTLPHLLSGQYRLDELVTSLGSGDRTLDLLISERVARTDGSRIELVPETMRQTFKELNSFYQALVIDCPPVLLVSDAIATAAAADFTILVIRLGQTRRRDLQRTVEMLRQNGANLLGAIVTFVEERDGYGYGYGYGSSYAHADER